MKKLLILFIIIRAQGGDSDTLPGLKPDSDGANALCETPCGNPRLSRKKLDPNYSFWHLTPDISGQSSDTDSTTSVNEADDELLDKIDLSVDTMEKEIKELEGIIYENEEILDELAAAADNLISMIKDTNEDEPTEISQEQEESGEYFDAVSHQNDNEESDEYFDAETDLEKSNLSKDKKIPIGTDYSCDQPVDVKFKSSEDAQHEFSGELSEQMNCESDNSELRGKCEDETEEGSENLGVNWEAKKKDENLSKMNGFMSFLDKIRYFISYLL